MKVPLNWLKNYIDINITQDELVKGLTSIGHMQDKQPVQVGGDTVLDLEVRQNRSDVLSMLGVAREVAALTNQKIKDPQVSEAKFTLNPSELSVEIANPQMCFRFKAIKIVGINKDCKTPQYMQEALLAYGVNLVSPVVDITNYVMLECGEPLHAFDAAQVANGKIVVRQAQKGETLKVLNGKVLTFTSDDLVIADTSGKILSFSGLIGGADSGITSVTKDVILEAATYAQSCIRRSSLRHGVRTEASTRHEKFLHPQLVDVAINRALDLILQICGGTVTAGFDCYPNQSELTKISFDIAQITRLTGINVAQNKAVGILESLGFATQISNESQISVTVPYWRTDVVLQADLVEEVVRILGYDSLPSNLPQGAVPKNIESEPFKLATKIKTAMVNFGFNEQITEPLIATPLAKKYKDSKVMGTEYEPIVMQNALNADKAALRPALGDVLIYSLKHAQKFGFTNIKLFEVGKAYKHKIEGQDYGSFVEERFLCFVIWSKGLSMQELFMQAKGYLDALCKEVSINKEQTKSTINIIEDFVLVNICLEGLVMQDERPKFATLSANIEFDINVKYKEQEFGPILQKIKNTLGQDFAIKINNPPFNHGNGLKSLLLSFTVKEGTMPKDVAIAKAENAVAQSLA